MEARVLSIIITYNGEWHIKKCLDSLLDSSLKSDVLVIDNASTDKTLQHIEEHKADITLRKLSENIGFGQANNIGFAFALKENYDFVVLLNQDAYLEPNTIEALVQMAIQHPKTKAEGNEIGVYAPVHLNGEERGIHSSFAQYFSEETISQFQETGSSEMIPVEVDMVPAAVWLLTMPCLQKVGGFDPIFFHYGEDDNFVHRMHHHGFSTVVVKNCFAHHEDDSVLRYSRSYYERQRTYMILTSIQHLLSNDMADAEDVLRKRLTKRIVKANLLMQWEDARDFRRIRKELKTLVPQMLNSAILGRQEGSFLS